MTEKISFGKCSICPLKNQTLVLGETNSEEDLSLVELLIVAEAPAAEEIKQDRPLCGPAGKVFREAFSKSDLDKIPYFITNTVLCSNIVDGKTQNPPPECIEHCKDNLEKIIEVTKPRMILIMGTIPMKRFGIGDSGILQKRGKLYKYNDNDVFLTVHPSYVLRNGGITTKEGRLYIDDFTTLYNILREDHIVVESKEEEKQELKLTEPYSYKLPEEFYNKEWMLIDIQRVKSRGVVLYIFKRGDEIKFHTHSDDDYYYYVKNMAMHTCQIISPIEDVLLEFGTAGSFYDNKEQCRYEGDVRIEMKHSIDYYYKKKEETLYPLNILYWDIELYMENQKAFPDITKAKHAINSISFKVGDGSVYVYLYDHLKMMKIDGKKLSSFDFLPKEDGFYIMDSEEEPGLKIKIKIYQTEKDLLRAFAKIMRTSNINVAAGWNTHNFDLPYLINRCKYFDIDIKEFSPFGASYYNDKKYGEFAFYGLYLSDMMELFKSYTPNGQESYSLSFTCQTVLGKDKVIYEGSIDDLYEHDIMKFIEYSGIDSYRLWELDKKQGYIKLKDEMRRVCSSTWRSSETTMGLLDPLVLGYAKQMNLVCRNSYNDKKEYTLPGAYVKHPKAGIHQYVIDFDFTAMYPTIILSLNLGPETFIAKFSDKIAKAYIYDNILPESFEIIKNPIVNDVPEMITESEFREMMNDNKYPISINGTIFERHDVKKTFFYHVVNYILESRKIYKDAMKEIVGKEGKGINYETAYSKQYAYKVLINALYGVLSNPHFRLFNFELAKTITLTGQELSKYTAHHINQYMKTDSKELDKSFIDGNTDNKVLDYIIGGDTDSIFLAMGDYLEEKNMLV